ncbi:MAG: transcriptional repressor LexA [Cyanobacteria bacterium P01_H01_bin.121]
MQPLTPAQNELFEWLVQYIRDNQHPPSIRQMMKAMELRSPAPVQSRLKHLQKKGYIDWTEGKARTIRILAGSEEGIPIRGAIAAGTLVEPFVDDVEYLDLAGLVIHPSYFALRVTGDSMIDEHITEGDVVIMRPIPEPDRLKNGTIVAARVDGEGTTLKRFFRDADNVTLQPANAKYEPIKAAATEVDLQGALVGVWRGFEASR